MTARLTDAELAALAEKIAAADPSPWHLVGKPWMDDDQCDTYAISGNTDPHAGVPVLSWVEPDLLDPDSEPGENEHKQRANLAAAVAAVNAAASLLAEVRESRAEITALRECERMLAVILPMARGYAVEHPVGRNAEMVEGAAAAIAGVRAGEGSDAG